MNSKSKTSDCKAIVLVRSPEKEGTKDDPPEAVAMLREAGQMWSEAQEKQFAVGKIVLRAMEEYGITIKQAHRLMGGDDVVEYSRMTRILKIVKEETYQNPDDRKGLSFYMLEAALCQYDKMDQESKNNTTPLDVAIQAGKSNKSARSVKAGIAKRILARKQKVAAKATADLFTASPELSEKYRFGDCREVLAATPEGSIKILHADVPYADYNRTEKGELSQTESTAVGMRSDCANANREDGLRLALDIVREAPRVLVKGGCLLLWQRGGVPARWEITKEIADLGLDAQEVTVRKNGCAPGNFSHAFSIATEKLLVIFRKGEVPADHTGQSNRRDYFNVQEVSDVLSAPDMEWPGKRYRQKLKGGTTEIGDVHQMMKPEELCRVLIERLSFEGELVVDACGCSGSFCIEAARAGRRFIYCEANRENYDWGVSRIEAANAPQEESAAA